MVELGTRALVADHVPAAAGGEDGAADREIVERLPSHARVRKAQFGRETRAAPQQGGSRIQPRRAERGVAHQRSAPTPLLVGPALVLPAPVDVEVVATPTLQQVL